MGFLNKVWDWTTGKSISFEKENEVYEDIREEINAINGLLDFYISSDISYRYTFNTKMGTFNLKNLRDYIILKQNSIKNTTSSTEITKIMNEIKKLEIIYEQILERVKNKMLDDLELDELYQKEVNINHDIYNHANIETFANFITPNLLTKTWSCSELEDLNKAISKRKIEIIPYLGKFSKK